MMNNRRTLKLQGGVTVRDIGFFELSAYQSDRWGSADDVANRCLNEDRRVVMVHGYMDDRRVTVKAHLDEVAALELAATLEHLRGACPDVCTAIALPEFVASGTCGVKTFVQNGMVISKGIKKEKKSIVLHCVVQTYIPGFTAEHFVTSAPDRMFAAEDNAELRIAAIDLEHWTWKPAEGHAGVVPGACFPACASDPLAEDRDWSIFTWQQLTAFRSQDEAGFDPRNFVWTRVVYGLRTAGVCGNEMALALTNRLARDVPPYHRPMVDPPVADDEQIQAFIDNMAMRARAPSRQRLKRSRLDIPRQCFDLSFVGIAKFLQGVKAFAAACSLHKVYPFDAKLANFVVEIRVGV